MNSFLGQLATGLPLGWLDWLAVALFTALWFGYGWYADYRDDMSHASLGREMNRYVRDWMARMHERDNRMLDVNILRSLMRSSQFFASTTMLILGALVALMGYTESAAKLVEGLPFAQRVTQRLWELKTLGLLIIFAYAFFKFSWSIRQFGFSSILVGASAKGPADPQQHAAHIDRITTITGFANRNFNQGLRAYYFGVAALSWFLHPVLMLAVTLAVVYVLHQREFRSRTLDVLMQ